MKDYEEAGLELAKIKEVLQAKIIVGNNLPDISVSGVFASDQMSDVLAFGKPGSILLTGLNTIQSVISSHMAEFRAIAYLQGKIPTDDMKRFAIGKEIVIFSTEDDMYEACTKLAQIRNNTFENQIGAKNLIDRENTIVYEFWIDGGDFVSAGMVSTQMKSILKSIGYDFQLIRRVTISAYEGKMNVVMHAKKARVKLMAGEDEIDVIIDDEGKGIPDIAQAMQEGFSTATKEQRALGFGAGMGLPNMKKNSDVLNIDSQIGKGTRVEMRFFTK